MTKKSSDLKLLNWGKVFLHSFLFLFFIALSILLFMIFLSKSLPSIDELKSFNPDQISKIISSDNEIIHKLQAIKKREVVKIGDVPQYLINALLLSSKIFTHNSEIFNIGSGVGTKLIEAVKLIIDQVYKLKKIKSKYCFTPFPENIDEIQKRNYISNIEKSNKMIKFHPKFNLKKGIKKSIELYNVN